MARLYVDENLLSLVEPLRNSGHDVVSAKEGEGQGKSDAWHFREAFDDQRTILTLDSDFYYLHGLWTTLQILGLAERSHAGILTAVQTKGYYRWRLFLRAIEDLLAKDEVLTGRMLTWRAADGKWRAENRKPWEGMI